eukprot:2015880-Rhodomonas_salina.3
MVQQPKAGALQAPARRKQQRCVRKQQRCCHKWEHHRHKWEHHSRKGSVTGINGGRPDRRPRHARRPTREARPRSPARSPTPGSVTRRRKKTHSDQSQENTFGSVTRKHIRISHKKTKFGVAREHRATVSGSRASRSKRVGW